MTRASLNWGAIDADPRFRRLYARKTRFLARLMAFAIVYYFLLPIGAAYFTDIFRTKVFGEVNFGVLFALSEFVAAWGIAAYYTVRAREFDAMAWELVREARRITVR
jgi:uncharacterized membrane protein (DUF485 family)